jgi:hypothetical protein
MELSVPGRVLDHINCDTSSVLVTEFRHGVILTCQVNGGGGECDFVNVPLPIRSAIPTLSEWGMLTAAAGLGSIGVFFAVRRR